MVAKHDKGEILVSGVINLVLVFSCHKVVIVLRPEKKKRTCDSTVLHFPYRSEMCFGYWVGKGSIVMCYFLGGYS